jgi:hypothetical protein
MIYRFGGMDINANVVASFQWHTCGDENLNRFPDASMINHIPTLLVGDAATSVRHNQQNGRGEGLSNKYAGDRQHNLEHARRHSRQRDQTLGI